MGLLDTVSQWLGGGGTLATVLVLGLDGAGKSALLAALSANGRGEGQQQALTTSHQFNSGGVSFTACEVSGAARHRALWERHYRRADAIIYVVDAADQLRLVVSRDELQQVLSHADICSRRVPLLLLANKSDTPLAMSPHAIAAALGLERVSVQPWHVCATSAASGAGVADGIAWLAAQLRQENAKK